MRDIDSDTVDALNFILDQHIRERDGSHQGNLTQAQTQIVLYLSHGLTPRMLAEVLGKSRFTIESQIRRARQAVNAKNTAQLVAIALRRGLID